VWPLSVRVTRMPWTELLWLLQRWLRKGKRCRPGPRTRIVLRCVTLDNVV
jgi:hypothetical protein